MGIHGHFCSTTDRPFVSGSLYHEGLGFKLPLQFMIDTGADSTFISPDYEKILKSKIDKKFFVDVPNNVLTLGGYAKYFALLGCKIELSCKGENAPIVIEEFSNITVWLLNRGKGKIPDETFPCMLGRDILHKMAIGYNRTNDCLFVTQKRITDYHSVISKMFPKPLTTFPDFIS